MSWFPTSNGPSWIQRACTSVIKAGPIPRHVAFIMDGNRRFAVKKSIERAEGHLRGFDKLAETLEWCRDLGITEVTVYAFSIENFKRSQQEVDCLMELAKQKFTRLLEEREMLDKNGVCVRIIGDLQLLPLDIQQLVAKVITQTQHNTQAILNVCFAYTARQEICDAIKLCAQGVAQGIIDQSDITDDLLEQCLYTNNSNPDLLVRTSGEVRLSDFLLLQSSYSVLSFVQVLWPDFSIWHLYAAVIHYQSNYDTVQKVKNAVKTDRLRAELEMESQSLSPQQTNSDQQNIQSYNDKRRLRLATFRDFIITHKSQYLDKLGTEKTVVAV